MIPGRFLHHLARLVCAARSVEQIVEPALADLQYEWKAVRTISRRAQVLLEGYAAVVIAIGWITSRTFFGNVVSLTWRDGFPMPAMFVVIMLLIGMAESWVRTGTIFSMWGQRLATIETRHLWALIPSLMIGRYWRELTWAARAIWLPVGVTSTLIATQFLPILRGWLPLIVWVLVTTVINAGLKSHVSVIKPSH
jgi:hypothetical protein